MRASGRGAWLNVYASIQGVTTPQGQVKGRFMNRAGGRAPTVTEYVVSNIDHTVPQYMELLHKLELVTDQDSVHTINPSTAEANELTATDPEDLMALYDDVVFNDGPVIMLNGSGTYHHLTYGMCRGAIDKHEVPYTMFHFDKHGDSRPSAGSIDCGNYLSKLTKDSPYATKQVVIGADSMVDNGKWMDTEVLEKGAGIYPYSAAEARFTKMDHEPDVDCVSKQYDADKHWVDVKWHTVEKEGIDTIVNRALDRTETDAVYITVDLDVLSPEYASTDWSNGKMSLDELLDAIKLIREEKQVLGIDITGTDRSLEESCCHTYYSIAAIVNEVTDGPHDREFFKDNIKTERGILRTLGILP